MAKRKKKDAICARIAYRVYGVLLEPDAVQGKEMYDMFPHSQCRLRGCHEGGTGMRRTREGSKKGSKKLPIVVACLNTIEYAGGSVVLYGNRVLHTEERRIARYTKKMAGKGISQEKLDCAATFLKDPANFPYLSIGERGESVKPESILLLKGGYKSSPNMDASMPGHIRITLSWMKRLAEDGEDAKIACMAQIGHEHAHHLHYIEHVGRGHANVLINWLNECYADTTGCRLAFGGDRERTHQAMEYLKTHGSDLSLSHHDSHPSWEFRQKIAERGVFDEGSVRMIMEEAARYLGNKRQSFHGFAPDDLEEIKKNLHLDASQRAEDQKTREPKERPKRPATEQNMAHIHKIVRERKAFLQSTSREHTGHLENRETRKR